MTEILVRFLVGGIVVCAFAAIGDILKPKSFAGLFGAAPSVALATLGLTVAAKGHSYTGLEARSMIAGAIAFFVFASCVSWFLMHRQFKALRVTLFSMPLWFCVAFGIWLVWLR